MVQELLAAGAGGLRSLTLRSWSPLHFAARGGHAGAVQALLGGIAHGSPAINLRTEQLETPLHLAAEVGRVAWRARFCRIGG